MDWRLIVAGVALATACGKTNSSKSPVEAGVGGASGSGGAAAGAGGQSALPGPRAFELVNTTDVPLYVDLRWPVRCDQSPAPGCSFSSWCVGMYCDDVPNDGNCCVSCEPPPPLALSIQPGETRSIDWDGRIYLEVQGTCTNCGCIQDATEPATYVGAVSASESYACELPPCVEEADGTIPGAVPTGTSVPAEVTFSLPSSDEAVVFVFE